MKTQRTNPFKTRAMVARGREILGDVKVGDRITLSYRAVSPIATVDHKVTGTVMKCESNIIKVRDDGGVTSLAHFVQITDKEPA